MPPMSNIEYLLVYIDSIVFLSPRDSLNFNTPYGELALLYHYGLYSDEHLACVQIRPAIWISRYWGVLCVPLGFSRNELAATLQQNSEFKEKHCKGMQKCHNILGLHQCALMLSTSALSHFFGSLVKALFELPEAAVDGRRNQAGWGRAEQFKSPWWSRGEDVVLVRSEPTKIRSRSWRTRNFCTLQHFTSLYISLLIFAFCYIKSLPKKRVDSWTFVAFRGGTGSTSSRRCDLKRIQRRVPMMSHWCLSCSLLYIDSHTDIQGLLKGLTRH